MKSTRGLARVVPAVLIATGCASLPTGAPQPAPAGETPAQVTPVRQAGNVGRIEVVQWPVVKIDRREFRAAPGARIMNTNNLMMTANQIPPNARVSYELDGMGQIRLIRILPPEAGTQ